MDPFSEFKIKLYRGVKIALMVLVVFLLLNALFGGSEKRDDGERDMITFSGHGEVTAVPDVANIYFTISKEAKTVKEAQALVAEVEKKSLDFLRANNVAEKDFKTSYASFSPKYDYVYDDPETLMMPCGPTPYGCPPRPGKSVIVGYTASESIIIKVRNIDDAGKIMQGLGTLGVSDLSGPNFAVDKEDELKVEARKKAIIDVKEKAKTLARDLGVRLGKITSFSESGNYPTPNYYNNVSFMSADMRKESAPAEIPKGENTISVDVTITYEIK